VPGDEQSSTFRCQPTVAEISLDLSSNLWVSVFAYLLHTMEFSVVTPSELMGVRVRHIAPTFSLAGATGRVRVSLLKGCRGGDAAPTEKWGWWGLSRRGRRSYRKKDGGNSRGLNAFLDLRRLGAAGVADDFDRLTLAQALVDAAELMGGLVHSESGRKIVVNLGVGFSQ